VNKYKAVDSNINKLHISGGLYDNPYGGKYKES